MTTVDPRFDHAVLAREMATAPTVLPPELAVPAQRAGGPRGLPAIDWGLTGRSELAPRVIPTPEATDFSPLPRADVVVITWTSAEWDALHYVFSNGLSPLPTSGNEWRQQWRPYRRDFYTVFTDLWSHRLIAAARDRAGGVPALRRDNMRWGSYTLVEVGNRTVLLFKSELHLNQDGEQLPLVPLMRQIVEDAQPSLVLSVGTAGGVADDQALGSAIVTNAAKYRLSQEFGTARFNKQLYRSPWRPPTTLFAAAERLMVEVPEFPVHPPTPHYPAGTRLTATPRQPRIVRTEQPILTTDSFEFGTTTNRLDREGCVVEMDDAVIAMVLSEAENPVDYGFVRNVSDPVINGELHSDLQTAWAVVTYQRLGLLTSYNGAIATWALIAAEAEENN